MTELGDPLAVVNDKKKGDKKSKVSSKYDPGALFLSLNFRVPCTGL